METFKSLVRRSVSRVDVPLNVPTDTVKHYIASEIQIVGEEKLCETLERIEKEFDKIDGIEEIHYNPLRKYIESIPGDKMEVSLTTMGSMARSNRSFDRLKRHSDLPTQILMTIPNLRSEIIDGKFVIIESDKQLPSGVKI